MAASTGQSIPNVVDRHRRTRVANLTKLIGVELDLLKESFEDAKCKIDPVIARINLARHKFDQVLQQGGVGEVMMEVKMERELQDLKEITSKLKLKIPFNLITPEYQPSADPNVIFQPQTHLLKPSTNSSNLPVVDDALLADKSKDFDYYSDALNNNPYTLELVILRCFLAFLEGAFINADMLCSFANGVLFGFANSESVVSTACKLVSKGFIKSVYKKRFSTTIDGFWMDPLVHQNLKVHMSMKIQQRCLVNSRNINGEDIIYSGSADASSLTPNLRFLHMGKWQRYPTHHNIQMPDPNLYFKYAGDMQDLMYISFRGISAMKELPSFITRLWSPAGRNKETKLKYLKILDLKACHHLEVLPSDIGNLWYSLTHLDMSECYYLDHMPRSLSKLVCLLVLKGFVVGEASNEEESCTLEDLFSIKYLAKLNIYTSLKTFPGEDHLTILQGFKCLRNLTICWGGCPIRKENPQLIPKNSPAFHFKRFVTHDADPVFEVKFNLEKLDLRGAPENGTPNWLRPSNFGKLEKLYIRGGQLRDLRHINESQKDKQSASVKEKGWSVKILRLRHLSKLHMDWSEVQNLFPNVVSVEKVECQNLTSFPCDEDGLWTKDTTQPPADGSERYGTSSCQRGPVECEDTAVEILAQTAEGSGISLL